MSTNKKDPASKLQTMLRLLAYVGRGNTINIIIVIVAIIISSIVIVISSIFIGEVVDLYIMPMLASGSKDFTGLRSYLGQIGLIFVGGLIATTIYNQITARIAQDTQRRLRDDLFTYMQRLPVSFFDQSSQGDLMSYYTNDIDIINDFLSQSLPIFIQAIFNIVIVVGAMVRLNLALSFITIFAASFMFLAGLYIATRSASNFSDQQRAIASMNGYVNERIQGQRVIKVFTHEAKTLEGFDQVNEDLRHTANTAMALSNLSFPVIMNMGNILYVVLAFLGAYMAIHGYGQDISLGLIVTFLNMSRALSRPIANLSNQTTMTTMALAGASRVFEVFDIPIEDQGGPVRLVHASYKRDQLVEDESGPIWAWKDPRSKVLIELRGHIELKKVYFAYKDGETVLHDINVFAKPGQKVAFVGPTGAGKTTITNLINRFYDIERGTITYDGIDIKDINKDDLRKSLATVLQDVRLFTGTILDNIRYGRPDATDEECIEAARLSNASEFIECLPKSYNTWIRDNGASLSQGQRQLISIARAAVANPPVMVLDEATSSIDTRTEILVQEGMDRLMKGRTVFVIAHRLSTIQNSDVIMFLDQGRIIERGDHQSLMEDQGKYYELQTGTLEIQ